MEKRVNMKKQKGVMVKRLLAPCLAAFLLLSLTSCLGNKMASASGGEVTGTSGRAFTEPTPHGMTLIKRGHLKMGIEKQDSLWGKQTPVRDISVEGFWMDEHEVTNSMYRQFVNYVRDSILRERLADPDPNEYLINIQGHQFANAAELLRSYSGWNASDFQNFQTWMKQTFAENAIIFLEKRVGTHYWANWDLAALTSLLSVGILCDDKALVDYAINYTANGAGMGSAAHATTATHSDDSGETLAQCQESGRDQGHSTLDVSLLGVLCQTAANAGAGDLFTSYNALEMAEYVAKYNLKDAEGNFVYSTIPFTSYTNGEYSHDAISADGRGSERNCWELFHAYAKTNAKADKYTEAWVKYFRQKNAYGEGEASTLDELGFGTLMFGAAAATALCRRSRGYRPSTHQGRDRTTTI